MYVSRHSPVTAGICVHVEVRGRPQVGVPQEPSLSSHRISMAWDWPSMESWRGQQALEILLSPPFPQPHAGILYVSFFICLFVSFSITYFFIHITSQPQPPSFLSSQFPTLTNLPPPPLLLSFSSEKVPPHPGASNPSRTKLILSHWGPTRQSS